MPSRKQNLEKVYEFALNAIADGDWDTAARLLSQLQRIEPGYRDVPQMIQFVDATRLAAQSSPADETSFLETQPKPKRVRKPKETPPPPPIEAARPAESPKKKKATEKPEPTPEPTPEVQASVKKKAKGTVTEPAAVPAVKPAQKKTPPVKTESTQKAEAPPIIAAGIVQTSKSVVPPEPVKKETKSVQKAEPETSPESESTPKPSVLPVSAPPPVEEAPASEEKPAPGFIEELEEALAEDNETAQEERKSGFQFTRRNIILLAILILVLISGLIFLSTRFSENKPLTMKEKMASMAPPTATETSPATLPAVATSIPLTSAPTLTGTQTPLPPTPTPTVTPTLGAGSSKVSSKDGATQFYVPAGQFLMGPAKAKVNMDAFWIDRTEVTNAMFLRCVDEGACPPPSRPSYKNPDFGEFPVIWVNWFQAQAYCRWAGRRLPTDAEWEKAARGTDGRLYPWGNEEPQSNLVNICDQNCSYNWSDKTIDDGYSRTVPVGSYPAGASPYGALDMSGNVWEWVADWYDEQIYLVPPSENPTGPELGKKRVIRGGSWNDLDLFIQTIHRDDLIPQYTLYNIGFRCAESP